jgi:hypothetical protein
MNPAKRKKLYRLSLAEKKNEVVAEEVKVLPTVPVIVEEAPVVEAVVEETPAPVEEVTEQKTTTKRSKKVVEPVSE